MVAYNRMENASRFSLRFSLTIMALVGFVAAVTMHIPAYFGLITIPQRWVHLVLVIGVVILEFYFLRSGLLSHPFRPNIEPRWARISTAMLFWVGIVYFVASVFVEIRPYERPRYSYGSIAPLIRLTANQYDDLHVLALSGALAGIYLNMFVVGISGKKARQGDGSI